MGWRLRGRHKLWEMGDGFFSFVWCFFVWFCVVDLGVVGRCNSVALFFFDLFYPLFISYYSKEMRLTYLVLFWFFLALICSSLFLVVILLWVRL